MAKRGMNERIQKLRELSVTTPVHIDLERAKIETEIFYSCNEIYGIKRVFLQEDIISG